MRKATTSLGIQYSRASKWLVLALLWLSWPLCAGAQNPAARHVVPKGEDLAGPVPESVRVLEEVIERLTDAPLYRDNSVELLLDGPETYAAMLEEIASAKHHVHLETYILGGDEIGAKFAAALEAKAREGVAVRVIYDSIGSRDTSGEFWEELQAAGASVLKLLLNITYVSIQSSVITGADGARTFRMSNSPGLIV